MHGQISDLRLVPAIARLAELFSTIGSGVNARFQESDFIGKLFEEWEK